jgi:hypothetical protein
MDGVDGIVDGRPLVALERTNGFARQTVGAQRWRGVLGVEL